ncbi:MAG: hypothetical protein WBW41_09785 [Verrucomicrobiia bacterium]
MKPALNLARQCPRFPSCSVNRCPLDSGYPNQFVDRQDKEKRCRMEKGVRLRIAATAPGTLRLGGLTLLEVAAKKRFESFSAAHKTYLVEKGKDRLVALHNDK